MKKLTICALVISVGFILGQTRKSDSASVENTLMQMEKDWSQVGMSKASLDKDVQTVGKILADDWTGVDFRGKTNTKSDLIADLKAGDALTASVELGPMKVRVFGDTAIVAGSDTEKSSYKGKDTSGMYVWTDIFFNRNGRWQVVASQSTKVSKP